MILPEQYKEYNNTAADYPDNSTIHSLFSEQVKQNPGRTALSWKDKSMTYSELDRLSGITAGVLMENGASRGSTVGILADHSPEMIISILGVLKSGAAYVPLDKEYPEKRIEYMLEDSGAGLLLTQHSVKKSIVFKGKILHTDDIITQNRNIPEQSVECTARDLAYIIYTSGSTGMPKGVEIEHRSLVNYCTWSERVYTGDGHYTFPLYSSPAFDLTVTSIFVPLISGSTIRIYNSSSHAFNIHAIMTENIADIIKLTPTHLKLLQRYQLKQSKIRKIIVGGEALPSKLTAEIHEKLGGRADIFNEYGPTETTVGCMIYRFRESDTQLPSVSIGVPAQNTQIYLLDGDLNPVTGETAGELYIAGDGLARGYRNRPDLTAERFVPNPFTPGTFMYRTGDLAEWLPDCTIMYNGRIDDQVKIMGYRIETGEVESAIHTLDGIKDCAVTVKHITHEGGENTVKQLAAYYVADREIAVEEFKNHLAGLLLQQMIPSYFIRLDSIPVTVNGKADKSRLPDPVF